MSKKTLAKPFTLAGFALGEFYMLFTVLAPNVQGPPAMADAQRSAIWWWYVWVLNLSDLPVPLSAKIDRVLASALFFGPFGAAAGLGVWLLVLSAGSAIRWVGGVLRPSARGSREARRGLVPK